MWKNQNQKEVNWAKIPEKTNKQTQKMQEGFHGPGFQDIETGCFF